MQIQATSNQLLAISAIIGVLLGISYLPVANTFSFRLTRLLYEDDTHNPNSEYYERPVFPRRDLKEEFGKVQYECLIESALSVDGGMCLNGDLEKISFTHADANAVNSPSETPRLMDQFTKRSREQDYGVDVTFPIHHDSFKNDQRCKDSYDEFLKGCREFYHSQPNACTESETDRIDMNRNQPSVMQNYTTVGFQKTKVPPQLMMHLKNFYGDNQDAIHSAQTVEKWHPGDTHVNHWKSRTNMLNVENPNHKGGGMPLKNKIWDAAGDILQSWLQTENPTTVNLQPASLYGIRVYKKGAVLAPHVDRLPLVTSAIINVAQDLDGGEPWPLEVYGHDGVAYNVTLEPGDMLLYESHSVIHGRPFPFQGKYYANVFIHFEPENHCLRHAERMRGNTLQQDAEEMYKRAQRTQTSRYPIKQQQESVTKENNSESYEESYGFSATELPFFIQPDTRQSQRWKQEIKYERILSELRQAAPPTQANHLASKGNVEALKKLAEEDPDVLFQVDSNGWQPLHEAARSGNTEVVQYLIEQGVDVNARTNAGKGASALWWAEEQRGVNHGAAQALRNAGATRLAPKL